MSTRSYTLTPRAAMLGSSTQPHFVRDGRLNALVERLAAQTNLSVGVFGMVGMEAQIFCWHNGQPPLKATTSKGIYGGMQERLSESAVGWLLLSAVERRRREGMLRRLNAESPPERQFPVRELAETIERAGDIGHASGKMGFGSIADVCAVLIPDDAHGRPMALGIVYEPDGRNDPQVLVELLRDAVATCLAAPGDIGGQVLQYSTAA